MRGAAVKPEVKSEGDAAAAAAAAPAVLDVCCSVPVGQQHLLVTAVKTEDGLIAAPHAPSCACCANASAAADGLSGSGRQPAVAGLTSALCESCVITVRFMGYFRVHQGSGQVFDAIDLFLPDTQFETQVGVPSVLGSSSNDRSRNSNTGLQGMGSLWLVTCRMA
jgi:hypothetical protein